MVPLYKHTWSNDPLHLFNTVCEKQDQFKGLGLLYFSLCVFT